MSNFKLFTQLKGIKAQQDPNPLSQKHKSALLEKSGTQLLKERLYGVKPAI